ncbi:hypothetical protein A5782_00465 [Mycobacterium sp. 852002-40037_SCH5390672]|nr:TIGR04255 family protein [Mycobacterium sp. 852002-40037_SCH5390672]OBC03023.1 hypothetical protein A5782_00465 [Mycobacterium sp. 852002-40037_SCH5390672]
MYAKPPVVEVICQVTFDEAVPWSVATPGVLFQALKDEYPADPTVMGAIRTTINSAQGGEIVVDPQAARFLFSNREQNRRLVANGTCLSVNALPPYEEWPNVVARFENAATAFRDAVADFTPVSASLRYINRIVIPEPSLNVSDYFTIPIVEAHRESAIQGFITRSQILLPAESAQLTITFGSHEHDVDTESAFLLDIEVSAPTNTGDVMSTMEMLHAIENVEFESSITNKCRELFQ